jgi:oxygen-dependent protoporphyrinogen oxidase
MYHVTIVGGGIAGLATAFYLQKKSQEKGIPLSYTLIEKDARFGGKISTTAVDDFIIEGGPDSFVTTKPWGMQLCRDLDLDPEIIPTNDEKRNVFILNKGKLTPFPGGYRLTVPTEFVPFALSPLISPLGKLRMALDLIIPARKEQGDESLASFIRRRLGQEALDKIGGPIMAGIYVADPERLSMDSTFPQFSELEREHGSLIKAMRQAKKKSAARSNPQGKPPAMFHSLRGGMNELVERLISRLKGNLWAGRQVLRIRPLSDGFELLVTSAKDQQYLVTNALVLATPAYVAAELLQPVEPELSDRLKDIRYISTATISLGYRWAEVKDQHDFNGFGFLIPKSENRQILACTWSSTKFNHRAPDDKVLLRVFVGGDDKEHLVNLPDDELLALVQAELADTMGITAGPVISKIFRWPKGNPQYDVGHLDRVSQIEALANTVPGLYLTGSAFRGIGIPDCVKGAITTVDQIIARVAEHARE